MFSMSCQLKHGLKQIIHHELFRVKSQNSRINMYNNTSAKRILCVFRHVIGLVKYNHLVPLPVQVEEHKFV